MTTIQFGDFTLECDEEDEKIIRMLQPKYDFKFRNYYVTIMMFYGTAKKIDLGWILTNKVGVVRFSDGNRRNYKKENICIEEFRN